MLFPTLLGSTMIKEEVIKFCRRLLFAFLVPLVFCSGIAVAIALQGRVPCKVIGDIKKGDMLVSAGAGYAKASSDMARAQIIAQAATAVLAQANTSQQTVLKLLQG